MCVSLNVTFPLSCCCGRYVTQSAVRQKVCIQYPVLLGVDSPNSIFGCKTLHRRLTSHFQPQRLTSSPFTGQQWLEDALSTNQSCSELTSHRASQHGRSSRWRWSTGDSVWWRCLASASLSSSADILKQAARGTVKSLFRTITPTFFGLKRANLNLKKKKTNRYWRIFELYLLRNFGPVPARTYCPTTWD